MSSDDSDCHSESSEEEEVEVEEEDVGQGLDPCLFTIDTSDHVFDIDFHPTEPLIAASIITGHVEAFRYDVEEDTVERTINHEAHKGSCRSVRFTEDGEQLMSVSAAKSLTCTSVESAKRVWQRKNKNPINALCLVDENTIAIGDDEGEIVLYDPRQPDEILRIQEHEDFISDMMMGRENLLLTTSGDGHLGVFDLRRKGKLHAMSDKNEDEFLSLALVKHGKKVLCGSQTGVISIFSWGNFGDMTDRLVGVPVSCDALAKVSEDTVIAGAADGVLRMVGIHPNKIKGVLGEHLGKDTAQPEPIEQLAITKDISLLASCAHDNTVKIWSLAEAHKVSEGKKSKTVQQSTRQNFFAGM